MKRSVSVCVDAMEILKYTTADKCLYRRNKTIRVDRWHVSGTYERKTHNHIVERFSTATQRKTELQIEKKRGTRVELESKLDSTKGGDKILSGSAGKSVPRLSVLFIIKNNSCIFVPIPRAEAVYHPLKEHCGVCVVHQAGPRLQLWWGAERSGAYCSYVETSAPQRRERDL